MTKRVARERMLTTEEATRYGAIRAQVAAEYPRAKHWLAHCTDPSCQHLVCGLCDFEVTSRCQPHPWGPIWHLYHHRLTRHPNALIEAT